ncbi:glycosyltransferase 87 family protein [Microbacterium invictum]|uniref:Glycosyltransferase 87 family protein n=1 Tax=Microbacterium invictum TaxID=515415 RepID=A0ABZ0V7Z2_9MICO|nr:glycosyltransferase 87 family protein [Microbacterium invictum]WQB69426.1 glycosyltransferase 87 family protein [Microbacterium invictum]
MSKRAVLWVAFVLVHAAVAVLGFLQPNQPMGDVYLVYAPWADRAAMGLGVVGITENWVYPALALAPILVTHVLAPVFGSYLVAWPVVVTALDAAAFAVLVGRGRSQGRTVAAWFWLVFIVALGPVGLYRLDAVTVPLAVAGCLWLLSRPWLAATLLAAATWIKVWPAALLLAALVAVRRRLALLGGAAALSAIVIGIVVAVGGARHLFGFVFDQTERGLQVEAPVSVYWLWRAVGGVADSRVYYDDEILTWQVAGPGAAAVSEAMTLVLGGAVAVVTVLGAVQVRRGIPFLRIFPALALSLVLVLIVTNKVGSPQYLTWIVAPLVVGLVLDRDRWWSPACLALVAAALTQLVYPLWYDRVLGGDPIAVGALTLRNILLAALLVWSVALLVRSPRRVPAPAAVDALT